MTVHFTSIPDWRQHLEDEQDCDDEEIETPADVKEMLGFDPADDQE